MDVMTGTQNEPKPKKITVATVRKEIPKLLKAVYLSEHSIRGKDACNYKVKNMWKNPPPGWPSNVPYVDPNNLYKKSDGSSHKLGRPKLMEMYHHLRERYTSLKLDVLDSGYEDSALSPGGQSDENQLTNKDPSILWMLGLLKQKLNEMDKEELSVLQKMHESVESHKKTMQPYQQFSCHIVFQAGSEKLHLDMPIDCNLGAVKVPEPVAESTSLQDNWGVTLMNPDGSESLISMEALGIVKGSREAPPELEGPDTSKTVLWGKEQSSKSCADTDGSDVHKSTTPVLNEVSVQEFQDVLSFINQTASDSECLNAYNDHTDNVVNFLGYSGGKVTQVNDACSDTIICDDVVSMEEDIDKRGRLAIPDMAIPDQTIMTIAHVTQSLEVVDSVQQIQKMAALDQQSSSVFKQPNTTGFTQNNHDDTTSIDTTGGKHVEIPKLFLNSNDNTFHFLSEKTNATMNTPNTQNDVGNPGTLLENPVTKHYPVSSCSADKDMGNKSSTLDSGQINTTDGGFSFKFNCNPSTNDHVDIGEQSENRTYSNRNLNEKGNISQTLSRYMPYEPIGQEEPSSTLPERGKLAAASLDHTEDFNTRMDFTQSLSITDERYNLSLASLSGDFANGYAPMLSEGDSFLPNLDSSEGQDTLMDEGTEQNNMLPTTMTTVTNIDFYTLFGD